MSGDTKQGRPPKTGASKPFISAAECKAMRILWNEDDYSSAELAMRFQAKDKTILNHVNQECSEEHPSGKPKRMKCAQAFREVRSRCPYDKMSQQVYNEYRTEDDPSHTTIYDTFGSWTNAREAALNDDNSH